jgi:hypothetical protein
MLKTLDKAAKELCQGELRRRRDIIVDVSKERK